VSPAYSGGKKLSNSTLKPVRGSCGAVLTFSQLIDDKESVSIAAQKEGVSLKTLEAATHEFNAKEFGSCDADSSRWYISILKV
jgi:hypothetical protein